MPILQVKNIVEFQGIYTRNIIKEGRFEGVIWPYLGKIAAKITTVQKIMHDQGKIRYNQILRPKQQPK